MRLVNIGLDFDGTITADPNIWYTFCLLAKAAGHKVYIVTMRYPEEVVEGLTEHKFDEVTEEVIYTHRKAKQPFVEALGIKIDIWIDDNPKAVHMDAAQVFGQAFPKGKTE